MEEKFPTPETGSIANSQGKFWPYTFRGKALLRMIQIHDWKGRELWQTKSSCPF
jgi:hypothetical protein